MIAQIRACLNLTDVIAGYGVVLQSKYFRTTVRAVAMHAPPCAAPGASTFGGMNLAGVLQAQSDYIVSAGPRLDGPETCGASDATPSLQLRQQRLRLDEVPACRSLR
jgi:hypothetical protein